MKYSLPLTFLGLAVSLSAAQTGCKRGKESGTERSLPTTQGPTSAPPAAAEPADEVERPAAELYGGFIEWVAQERTTAGENVPKNDIVCVTDDPADPLYGTCSATSFRMVRWYKNSRKAFLFVSEAEKWSKPGCAELGAIELRRWTTKDELAFRCSFRSGPLDGLELHIAHEKADTFTRIHVASPEYLDLDQSYRHKMDNEAR